MRLLALIVLLSGCVKTYVETPAGIRYWKHECMMTDQHRVDAIWLATVRHAQALKLIKQSPLDIPAVCLVNAEKFYCGSISVRGCVQFNKTVYVARQHASWCATLAHEMIGYLAWTRQITLSRIEEEFLKDPHYHQLLGAVKAEACAG